VDIKKILAALGASLPVVVVGGAVAISRVADPPEDLLNRILLGGTWVSKLPKEEREKIYEAYSLCHELAQLIEWPAINMYSLVYAETYNPTGAREQAIRVLEHFENYAKNTIRQKAEEWHLPSDKAKRLEDIFMDSGDWTILMAKTIKKEIEEGAPRYRVFTSALINLDIVLRSTKNSFVECLMELNALKI
jgi:hypothetical protein